MSADARALAAQALAQVVAGKSLRATFAAPPGIAAVRSIAITGIGASGEMRSTEP